MRGFRRAEARRMPSGDPHGLATADLHVSGSTSAPESRTRGTLPPWLERDLRSDHAGEAGAVQIYRGILAVARDEEVRTFAHRHLQTERMHLERIEGLLPPGRRSRLLPLWRLAGYLTGALPALLGRTAVFATIDAVESFVDDHYRVQVERLARSGDYREIRHLLEQCRLDEVEHRDDARGRLRSPGGRLPRLWRWMVAAGSAMAVVLARRV